MLNPLAALFLAAAPVGAATPSSTKPCPPGTHRASGRELMATGAVVMTEDGPVPLAVQPAGARLCEPDASSPVVAVPPALALPAAPPQAALKAASYNPPRPAPSNVTASHHVITRTYDDFDRVETETVDLEGGGTGTISYTYYRNGLRKTVTDSQGRVTFYEYNGRNLLSRVTTGYNTPDAQATSYEYWPDNLLKTIRRPNGVNTAYTYDLADRVETITTTRGTTRLQQFTYGYDDNGNRLSQIEENGGAPELTTYGYDDLDRLKEVRYPDGKRVTYGYDPVGNRTSEQTYAGDTLVSDKTAVFDGVNRLTSVTDAVDPAGNASFTYDRNGNLLSKTTSAGTEEFVYDTRDLLVETRSGTSITARFAYDALGRRYLKIGEEGIRQYLYDQTSTLEELDEHDVSVAKYEYGATQLGSFFRRDEARRYYHLDALGSVTALSDGGGDMLSRYHLDAWGSFRDAAELDASRNRFAFTGYLFDRETDLYYAKARYYDPVYGRFTTQDSVLGRPDDPPSLHRYYYGIANPVRYVDPTGHASIESEDLANNDLRSRIAAFNPSTGRIHREELCGAGNLCVTPREPDARVKGILRAAGGDKDQALHYLDQLKATNNSSAAVVVLEDSDFDSNGRLNVSGVYQQFLKTTGDHAAAIRGLREEFEAAISGAKPGEIRDVSFLYNVAYEYSAARAYELADTDAKTHFGPDFIQRHAHLLGQYGAAPPDVSLEAGTYLAADTLTAAATGLGIYRAARGLISAGGESSADLPLLDGSPTSAQAERVTGRQVAELRREFETSTRPEYWKEYARQIDGGAVDNPFGRSEMNMVRMRRGDPPIGPDGRSVPLHHIRPLSRGGTNEFDNLVPINQTTHQRYTRLLHSEPFPGNQYHAVTR